MPPLRVGILGFGTVGSSVARRLVTAALADRFTLTHIVDRRAHEKRRMLPPASIDWSTDVERLLTSAVGAVVETVGGAEPAGEWIRRALLAGMSVVTANKQVMATRGLELLRLAERQGRQLRFEAAVGGAVPIVRAVADGLAGDDIWRIVAILNGTTNAVLSRMEATGCAIHEAIRDASRHGYAEADPTLDLDGHDARSKLAILCALAFGLKVVPDAIPISSASGISPEDFVAARRTGSTIRQLAHAEYDRETRTLTAWVRPERVPIDSIFGRTKGPQNSALVTGTYGGTLGMFGAGAGGSATAVAIVSDLLAIARDRAAIVPAPATHSNFEMSNVEVQEAATC